MSRTDPENILLPFSSQDPQSRIKILLKDLEKAENRKDLTWLGDQLGKLINRRPFSYKYIHSVLRGSLEAGWPLRHAIEMAFLRQDGVSPLKAMSKEMTVVSDQEIEGLFVMGSVKTCAAKNCMVQFVDNHPARKYCPFCSPPKRR
jgi:hypothetical protein